MERFRHPGAHHQGEERRQQADQEQAAPADLIGEERREGRGDHHAQWNEHGDEAADEAAHPGGHELLHQRQIDAVKTADAEAHEEAHDGQIDPAIVGGEIQQPAGDGEIQHSQDEHLAPSVQVGDSPPDHRAQDGADAGGKQNDGRHPAGQLPGLDDESQNERDQVIIEEFQHVADDGGGDDLHLIGGQGPRLIQAREHRHSLQWALACFSVIRHV